MTLADDKNDFKIYTKPKNVNHESDDDGEG